MTYSDAVAARAHRVQRIEVYYLDIVVIIIARTSLSS
jgi:hypothetical protein